MDSLQTSKQIGDAAEYFVLANLTVKGGFEVFKMPDGMRNIDIGVMIGGQLKSVQVKSRLPVSDNYKGNPGSQYVPEHENYDYLAIVLIQGGEFKTWLLPAAVVAEHKSVSTHKSGKVRAYISYSKLNKVLGDYVDNWKLIAGE